MEEARREKERRRRRRRRREREVDAAVVSGMSRLEEEEEEDEEVVHVPLDGAAVEDTSEEGEMKSEISEKKSEISEKRSDSSTRSEKKKSEVGDRIRERQRRRRQNDRKPRERKERPELNRGKSKSSNRSGGSEIEESKDAVVIDIGDLSKDDETPQVEVTEPADEAPLERGDVKPPRRKTQGLVDYPVDSADMAPALGVAAQNPSFRTKTNVSQTQKRRQTFRESIHSLRNFERPSSISSLGSMASMTLKHLWTGERSNYTATQRRAYVAAVLAADSSEYVQPEQYEPVFCRYALIVTTIFMVLEILVAGFEFEPLNVNPTLGPPVDAMVVLGAKDTEKMLDGQVHRLFTPMLLHAGLLHLFFNMLGLYNIGFPAEREFGSWKIGSIYITSGVFGVLLSSIFLPGVIGVGASGAIFGLFGSAWADLVQNWNLYGDDAKRVLRQLTFTTILNLGLGLLPFLDNFAHIGGFLCGMIMGFALLVQTRYDVLGRRKEPKKFQIVLQKAAKVTIPLLLFILLLVFFLEVDLATSCSFCQFLSCVPIPLNAAPEDRIIDCPA